VDRKGLRLATIEHDGAGTLQRLERLRLEGGGLGEHTQLRGPGLIQLPHTPPVRRHGGQMLHVETLRHKGILHAEVRQEGIHAALVAKRCREATANMAPTQGASHMRGIDFHVIG
jgi:hypothetical protein